MGILSTQVPYQNGNGQQNHRQEENDFFGRLQGFTGGIRAFSLSRVRSLSENEDSPDDQNRQNKDGDVQ